MFDSGKGAPRMNTGMYATRANDMAGTARVRAAQPCPASAFAVWSPITLGTDRKHGRPRRLEVSHQ